MYSCGRNIRTVLVNAANASLVRLFAADHVVSEVWEHSEEWTAGTDVPQGDFLARWLTEFLPLIRVFVDDADPSELLTPEETARLAALHAGSQPRSSLSVIRHRTTWRASVCRSLCVQQDTHLVVEARRRELSGVAARRCASRSRGHGHRLRRVSADSAEAREHDDPIELAKRHGVRFCCVGSSADLRVNCVIAETYILSSADRAVVLRTIAEG